MTNPTPVSQATTHPGSPPPGVASCTLAEKTEGGRSFPSAAYAYVPDPDEPSTWKLRLWESPEKHETTRQVGAAVAALGKGFRGNKVQLPGAARVRVVARIRAAWRKVNTDKTEDDMPPVLKKATDPGPGDVHVNDPNFKTRPRVNRMRKLRKKLAKVLQYAASGDYWDPTDPDNDGDGGPGSIDDPSELSYQEVTSKLQAALIERFGDGSNNYDQYPYVVATKDDHVYFQRQGSTYCLPYVLEDGEVRLDPSEPVETRQVYVRASETEATKKALLKALNDKFETGSADLPIYDQPQVLYTHDNKVVFRLRGDTWMMNYVVADGGAVDLNNYMVRAHRYFGETDFRSLSDPQLLRFSEKTPEWIPLLPKPGTYTHPSWGEVDLSEDRLKHFVSIYKDRVYQQQLPVDAEHQTKLSGALAWIVDVRLNEDSSVDARVEWTGRGKSLVGDDRFKYVSPEWYDEWEDPATNKVYTDVLIGAAVTTRPFFKEGSLRPLAAGEGTDGVPGDPKLTGRQGPAQGTGEHQPMSDENKAEESNRQFAELNAKVLTIEGERDAAKAAAERYASDLKTATERIEALERSASRDRYKKVAKKWYGEREKNVDLLEKLAKAFGEESDEFKTFVTNQDAVAAQMKQSGLFKEIGSDAKGGSGGAKAELEAKAKKMSEEQKVTYEQAYAQVVVAEPDLVVKMRAEQAGR